jgi:DNA-binding LytR/AlgR family response regulator
VAEFKAFTHSPDRKGIAKAFIDINLNDECGIGLAKSMKLNQSETQLFFVSGTDATAEQKTQISDIGGTFLLKENLVKTVIFPE